MPTDLPIAAAPVPTAVTPLPTASGNTAEAGVAFDDLAAETQTFMQMLSQLLDEGAVVVAAPTQNVQDVLGREQTAEANEAGGEVLGAVPAYESLLSLLLPPPPPAAGQQGNANASSDGVDADGHRSVAEALPLTAANAATLQRTVSKSGDATVAIEFETQLAAQTANALLSGTEKTQASESKTDALPAVADNGERLTTQGLSQSNATQAPSRPQLVVAAHVGTQSWPDELAAKATFVHERGLQSASLRLSPEHLGPMEIQITVQDDKASVWFGAAHAETRTALEQALPRLRELLGSQGLSLSDAGVFREPPRDQARAYAATSVDGVASETEERDIVVRKRNGLLDTYA